MRFSSILILFASTGAWALPSTLPETTDGIFLVNALQRVASFVKSAPGQVLFDKEFSSEAFAEKADQVVFKFSSDDLIDMKGERRCLMNYDGSTTIHVHDSEECVAGLQSDPSALHATLFHEVLNMLQVERPSSVIGSVYTISRKILGVDIARIEIGQEFILHPTCEVVALDSDLPDLPFAERSFLEAKGYSYRKEQGIRHEFDVEFSERPLALAFGFDLRERSGWRLFEIAILQVAPQFSLYLGSAHAKWLRRIEGRKYRPRRPRPEESWRTLFHMNARAKFKVIRPGREDRQTEYRILNFSHPLTKAFPTIPDCVKLPVAKR